MNRTRSITNSNCRTVLSLWCAAILSLSLGACELPEPVDGADASPGPDVDQFTQLYESASFQMCAGCHAPDADGFTDGTEATQDWTTRDTAYQSLQGVASGMMGNFEGCNGVPFIGDTPETSLLLATFDDSIRAEFTLADFADCNVDSISDMTLKIGGPLSMEELDLLTQWLADGAPDMPSE